MAAIGRRTALLGAAALGTASLGAPFLARAQGPEFSFKVGINLAESHPTVVRMQQAADRVARQSNGRLQLRLFPNSQLGGEADLLNQVRAGALEVFPIGALVIASSVPMAALAGTGFAFRSYDQVWPAIDGGLGDFIRKSIRQSGVYVASTVWDLGFRQITSGTKPVHGVPDLAGFNIRVPSGAPYLELFQALGAAPTAIQFPQVYAALQSKAVDGEENPLAVVVTSRFFEVQKYVSITNHIWDGFFVLINERAWRSLPPNLQNILETQLNAAGLAQRNDLAAAEILYQQTLQKAGLQIDSPHRDPFRAKLRAGGYYAELRKRYGKGAWTLLEEAVGSHVG